MNVHQCNAFQIRIIVTKDLHKIHTIKSILIYFIKNKKMLLRQIQNDCNNNSEIFCNVSLDSFVIIINGTIKKYSSCVYYFDTLYAWYSIIRNEKHINQKIIHVLFHCIKRSIITIHNKISMDNFNHYIATLVII